MILDKNYFNNIRLETVRKKFYNADAVDRLLVDIRSKADGMTRELLQARAECEDALKTADALREENEDLRNKGRVLYQKKLSLREDLKNAQQSEVEVPDTDDLTQRLEEAEKAKQAVVARSRARQEEGVEKMETLLSSLRELQNRSMEQINAQWEEILSSLEDVPLDLTEKVGQIAKELNEIEELQ